MGKKENPTILEKQVIGIMDLFPLNFPLNCCIGSSDTNFNKWELKEKVLISTPGIAAREGFLYLQILALL